MDYERRDKLIFNQSYKADKYVGGIREFEGLSLDTLQTLVKEGFLHEDSAHNYSPTIREFLEYASKSNNKRIVFEGFADSADRNYKNTISITGISADFDTYKDALTFASYFGSADEFNVGDYSGYAWWD